MEMALPRQIGRFETADRDLSDPLLAAIVEEAATEIYVFDFETQSLLLANRKARDNTGYGAAEIGAMSIEDVFEADSHDDLKAALRTVEAAAPDPVVYSGRHLRRDGTSYAVEARATLGLSGGRRVVYQFAADRTAANRASERARRVAELQLLCAEIGLAADIPAGVLKWLLSDGGWTLGCFIPMSVSDPELSEAWIGERSAGWDTHDRQAMATFVRSEMFHSFRSVWVDDFRLDGAKSPVSLLMMPLEARGKIVGSFGMIAKGQVRDSELTIGCEETQARLSKVYCLKMSEEELSEARECLEAVDSADTGLWCYNYRTGKFFLSDRAQEILGRSRGQRMPAWTEFGARLHPDDIESTRQSMRRHAAYGAPYRAEYRYRLNGSDYIWLKVRGRGAWGKDGAIVRTAGTLVDITAEKNADLLRRDLMSAMTSDADLDQKLSMVLSKAAAYLEMSDGVVCHFSDGDCDILHATAGGGPWRKGATHPLNDLIWSDIFSAEGVKAYPDLSDSALSAHPARSRFDIAALIGAPIFVKGLRFGTLCFISDSAKDGEFPELKLTTIRSLARWIGEELGRAAKLANLVASDAIKAANLACIGDAVLTVNQTGCIEDANPAASELFGWNTESLRRMYIEQVLPGARAISGPDGLLPVRSRQDVVMRRNGERVAVLLHISDVQLLDRKLSTVVLTDLTLVKQAEAAKRDFVSVVSH
jgi:PAS domain S-box-containing protein